MHETSPNLNLQKGSMIEVVVVKTGHPGALIMMVSDLNSSYYCCTIKDSIMLTINYAFHNIKLIILLKLNIKGD